MKDEICVHKVANKISVHRIFCSRPTWSLEVYISSSVLTIALWPGQAETAVVTRIMPGKPSLNSRSAAIQSQVKKRACFNGLWRTRWVKSEKAAMVGGGGEPERVKTFIVHHAKSNILPRYFGQPLLIRMFEGIMSKNVALGIWDWSAPNFQSYVESLFFNILHLKLKCTCEFNSSLSFPLTSYHFYVRIFR